jgi:hypothetical protein
VRIINLSVISLQHNSNYQDDRTFLTENHIRLFTMLLPNHATLHSRKVVLIVIGNKFL